MGPGLRELADSADSFETLDTNSAPSSFSMQPGTTQKDQSKISMPPFPRMRPTTIIIWVTSPPYGFCVTGATENLHQPAPSKKVGDTTYIVPLSLLLIRALTTNSPHPYSPLRAPSLMRSHPTSLKRMKRDSQLSLAHCLPHIAKPREPSCPGPVTVTLPPRATLFQSFQSTVLTN